MMKLKFSKSGRFNVASRFTISNECHHRLNAKTTGKRCLDGTQSAEVSQKPDWEQNNLISCSKRAAWQPISIYYLLATCYTGTTQAPLWYLEWCCHIKPKVCTGWLDCLSWVCVQTVMFLYERSWSLFPRCQTVLLNSWHQRVLWNLTITGNKQTLSDVVPLAANRGHQQWD